ncbi:MAG TPA: PEGA domain-containing protein, partial [Vicinamibacteria bacterium]
MRDDELIHPVPYAPRVLRPARAPRPRRRWPRPITLLALLVVGLLGTFLLAARAVQVRVEPEPQRLEVHGWPHIRAGSVRLLLPGHYRVVAERPGYRRLEAPLEVTGDPRQIARFVLERLPGLLDVRATPPAGVRVSIDGQERGTTPLRPFEVAAGEHEVRLRAEGYAPLETRVTLAGGGATQVLEVTLVPDRAPVTFDSDPRGATVRVDGREVGNTPLTVDLTSGDRRVDVSLEGFEPVSRRIVVVAERPMRVPTLGLRPMPGRLAL